MHDMTRWVAVELRNSRRIERERGRERKMRKGEGEGHVGSECRGASVCDACNAGVY